MRRTPRGARAAAPSRRALLRATAGLAVLGAPRMPARAAPPSRRQLLFVTLDGGLSHLDSFDPKPALRQHAGRTAAQVRGDGAEPGASAVLTPSPWPERVARATGIAFAEPWAELSALSERLVVVRGMNTSACEHTGARTLLATGFTEPGHPALGAWLAHALGPRESGLPAYVCLDGAPGRPAPDLGAGPLSRTCAPVRLAPPDWLAGPPGAAERAAWARRDRLVTLLDRRLRDELSGDAQRALDAGLLAGERERRLRERLPALWRLAAARKGEAGAIGAAGGELARRARALGPAASAFVESCALAPALLEAGVRTVSVRWGNDRAPGADGCGSAWDAHERLDTLEPLARCADAALGALLRRLESRGLLGETLVVIATEFGRSPLGRDGGRGGRGHNPGGFSVLLAGAGLRGGKTWGATDELGQRAVDKIMSPGDLLATALHYLNVNPTDPLVRHGGRIYAPVDAGAQVHRLG